MSSTRTILLKVKGLPVFFLQSDSLQSIIARAEWESEHTLWSFLGCGRHIRQPCVRIIAWTNHGPFTTTIRTESEDESSEMLDDLIAQIPVDLNEDLDEEDGVAAEQEDAAEQVESVFAATRCESATGTCCNAFQPQPPTIAETSEAKEDGEESVASQEEHDETDETASETS